MWTVIHELPLKPHVLKIGALHAEESFAFLCDVILSFSSTLCDANGTHVQTKLPDQRPIPALMNIDVNNKSFDSGHLSRSYLTSRLICAKLRSLSLLPSYFPWSPLLHVVLVSRAQSPIMRDDWGWNRSKSRSQCSLLAEASFPCTQRAGEKRPLPWVEWVCVEHAPRFLSVVFTLK